SSLSLRSNSSSKIGNSPFYFTPRGPTGTCSSVQVSLRQSSDMRGVGTQPVLDNNHGEMRVILAEFRKETLGRVTLAVVRRLTILLDDRLGHQRDDFAEIGMDERRGQHLMVVGKPAVLRLALQARLTV